MSCDCYCSVVLFEGDVVDLKCVNVLEFTVLPAKSDSDVMFCVQSYHGLIIDRSLDMCINPIRRI